MCFNFKEVTSPKNEEPQQNRGRSKFLEPSTLERRRKNNPTNNNPQIQSKKPSLIQDLVEEVVKNLNVTKEFIEQNSSL